MEVQQVVCWSADATCIVRMVGWPPPSGPKHHRCRPHKHTTTAIKPPPAGAGCWRNASEGSMSGGTKQSPPGRPWSSSFRGMKATLAAAAAAVVAAVAAVVVA